MTDLRPIPLGRSYGAVIADPPWHFENFSPAGTKKGAAEQYECMDIRELRQFARDINLDFLCAPDCALLMWATFPLLPDAVALLAEWGFLYKSGGAWAKVQESGSLAFGTGYIYRGAAELWLLGVRGRPLILSHSERNLILAPRREHSVKPDDLHRSVERQFRGPYLELFARRPFPGWDSYGNELGGFVPAEARAA